MISLSTIYHLSYYNIIDYIPHAVHFIPVTHLFYFIFKNLFIYLFLAALGLCCWAQAFSSCVERGLLFVVVRRLLIAVASLVSDHGL